MDDIDQESILQKGKLSTSRREMQELLKRYNALTSVQIELLQVDRPELQKQLAYVAMCKTYKFLFDFVMEVVREKYLVFDFELSDADFRSFINRKKELHPELEDFAESTLKKAKQHTFKILEEAGIINSIKARMIQPQWIDGQLKSAVINDNPEYLKLFLVSDKDIQSMIDGNV